MARSLGGDAWLRDESEKRRDTLLRGPGRADLALAALCERRTFWFLAVMDRCTAKQLARLKTFSRARAGSGRATIYPAPLRKHCESRY